eukprot:10890040-Prorocentrum_lima.AAC.1
MLKEQNPQARLLIESISLPVRAPHRTQEACLRTLNDELPGERFAPSALSRSKPGIPPWRQGCKK